MVVVVFFFNNSQILPLFKYSKFNLFHTHLPVTNWNNHLIKFQSFSKMEQSRKLWYFFVILFILLNYGIWSCAFTYNHFCLPNLCHVLFISLLWILDSAQCLSKCVQNVIWISCFQFWWFVHLFIYLFMIYYVLIYLFIW